MPKDEIQITLESSWDDVLALAPWYLNNTLDKSITDIIDAWLASHSEYNSAWQDELNWWKLSQGQLQSIVQDNIPSPMPSLSLLKQKIVAESVAAKVSPDENKQRISFVKTLQAFFNRYFVQQAGAWALGLFAFSIGQMMLIENYRHNAAEQTILGAEQTTQLTQRYQVITIAFEPTITEWQMREQLDTAGAYIIKGPSALGLYDIAVPKANAQETIERWRSNTQLFESIQE